VRRFSGRWLRGLQISVFLVASGLLAAHVLKWDRVRIDNVTLALVGILLVTPLLDRVTRIKLGDFEAEIDPNEVRRARAKVADDLTPEPDAPKTGSLEEEVRALLRHDPQLAMAKVRIELEDTLKRLHETVVPGQTTSRNLSLGRRIDDLNQHEILSPSLSGALRDVLSLANRAIHGERVEPSVAEDLALLGVRLVFEIQDAYMNQVLKPIETGEITKEERERLQNARYRVTTVVPLVDRPERKIYLLDQDGLDELLECYEEYAEFIVSVEPLP